MCLTQHSYSALTYYRIVVLVYGRRRFQGGQSGALLLHRALLAEHFQVTGALGWKGKYRYMSR